MINNCEECHKKQREIDRLKEDIKRLKAKFHLQKRKADEGYFGSSTPSSKIPIKSNASKETPKKRGLKLGHKGNGRNCVSIDEVEKQVDIAFEDTCPDCGGKLQNKDYKERSVLESQPRKVKPLLYRLQRKYCPHCGKTHTARAPNVLPKCLFGNQTLVNAVTAHYLHGVPIGRISEQLGVNSGSIVTAFHSLAKMFSEVPNELIERYRKSFAKHADETGWRTNGKNGYAWLFATEKISIYQFKTTRSASVPRAVFGEDDLEGVLVVDRYAGYNRMRCKLQYCYAHLLRDVKDLEKEFPDDAEIRAFVATVAPLLAVAMGLRNQAISDKQFYAKAKRIKKRIQKAMTSSAQHFGIIKIQNIFSDKADRLYHWADDRRVPADNNRAERDLRPTVIARKVSFGSYSDGGAKTRGILMTTLLTMKKNCTDVEKQLKLILDEIAQRPNTNPTPLITNLLPP